MTAFRYEAARHDGARVRGRLDAGSAAEAAAVLSQRGLFPVRLRETDARAELAWRRPSMRALATAMQGLAALVEAGVPLHRALEAAAQLSAGTLRHALGRVQGRVREGATLGAALAPEQGLFPPVTIGLIRAGELGVGLAAGLAQASRQLERDADTRASVRAALAYPLLLVTVGVLSVGAILFVVVPRFAALLTDVEAALPAATRALLTVSSVVRAHPIGMGVGVAALLALAAYLVRRYRAVWAALLLDVPVVGAIGHGLATARVTRALGALLGSGVSALPALAIAREAAGNPIVRTRLAVARERVAEGAALADALAATRAVTPSAVQLARIGEGSGRLAELLERAADLEEQTARRRLQALVAALEPALIVAFAALVAFVAAALLQAIYGVRPGAL